MIKTPLMKFVKDTLGYYGDEQHDLLYPLILGAQEYLKNAGVAEPTLEDVNKYALYQSAVTARVKILHDGDPKGEISLILASIVSQMRAGGE